CVVLHTCSGADGALKPAVGAFFMARCEPQIGDAVVEPIVVDVVNLHTAWIKSVCQQPCDAVGWIEVPGEANAPIDALAIATSIVPRTGDPAVVSHVHPMLAGLVGEVVQRPCAPREDAGVWIVVQALANEA